MERGMNNPFISFQNLARLYEYDKSLPLDADFVERARFDGGKIGHGVALLHA